MSRQHDQHTRMAIPSLLSQLSAAQRPTRKPKEDVMPREKIGVRMRQILDLMADGKIRETHEIAAELKISTDRTHSAARNLRKEGLLREACRYRKGNTLAIKWAKVETTNASDQ